ncbi:MAG: N-acetylmuramoyl-L-alanine amidase [Clostridiales bacterium]|nr:N-acetylmuramoyl-L-alanine amidase [Clostridiales bacterium]
MAKKRTHRRKRLSQKTKAMLRLTIFLMAVAACALYFAFRQQATQIPSDVPEQIVGIPVHTKYIPQDSQARSGRTRAIHYIVIHETDNTGAHATAKAHSAYLQENCWKEQKSWHYTVDDHEIWHHLPDNEVGYHAGDSSWKEGGNRNGIGIELCVNQGGNFEQTMRNAAQLTAYLLLQYHLTIDDVKKHQDFSGKICPSTIIETNRWQDFLNMVQEDYTAQKTQRQQAGA